MKLFAIFDSKVKAFILPFPAPTCDAAVRNVAKSCYNSEHDFSLFGADYTLFHIGEWHEETGTFSNLDAHESLGTALQIAASYGQE